MIKLKERNGEVVRGADLFILDQEMAARREMEGSTVKDVKINTGCEGGRGQTVLFFFLHFWSIGFRPRHELSFPKELMSKLVSRPVNRHHFVQAIKGYIFVCEVFVIDWMGSKGPPESLSRVTSLGG
jgi:hypothetical protein